MQYASIVARLSAGSIDGWQVHREAMARRARGESVLLLSIGDPDVDTPSAIVAAAEDSLRQGRTHYSSAAGETALRAAIAAYYGRITGYSTLAEQVVVTQGAQGALFASLSCLVEAGDEVVITTPCYSTYRPTITAVGATAVAAPLREQEGFRLDPERIAAAISSRTRAVLINTPHNPTGVVYDPADLAALAALCQEQDLWLIVDEVYADLSFEKPHTAAVNLPGMAERTVVLGSLSKSHAMSGWRLGWVIAPEELACHLTRLSGCLHFGLAPFIQDAAVTALQDDAVSQRLRKLFQSRRNRVVIALDSPLLRCVVPEAGMFVLLDIRQTGWSSPALAMALLEQAGVAVLPGEAFGPELSGYLRLSLGVDETLLEEACGRICRCVATLVDNGCHSEVKVGNDG